MVDVFCQPQKTFKALLLVQTYFLSYSLDDKQLALDVLVVYGGLYNAKGTRQKYICLLANKSAYYSLTKNLPPPCIHSLLRSVGTENISHSMRNPFEQL